MTDAAAPARSPDRSVDWRLPALWASVLCLSMVARVPVEIADAAQRGVRMSVGHAVVLEGASHIVVAALLPALYWLHRRWPLSQGGLAIAIHLAAVVPYSLVHTLGMAALRLLWFNAIQGEAYVFPLTAERLGYEFAKDVLSYMMLSAGISVLGLLLARYDRRKLPAGEATADTIADTTLPASAAAPPSAPTSAASAAGVAASTTPDPVPDLARPERFAVRQRGREIVVEVADIDWIEAAGNYAVLHVGDEILEIRSSLARLEAELDPKRFVRVHKSHLVNVARIVEVTPWVSGDWRIRLQGGAEINLSRRYRQRFEALVPVKS